MSGGTNSNSGINSITHSLGTSASSNAGFFQAFGSTNQNTAIRTSASDNTAGINIAVEARAVNGSANYAIYASVDTNQANSYSAYLIGDVVVNGNVTVTSDANLKENVTALENTDSLLQLLNPVEFDYLQTGNASQLHLPSTRQMGLIAQEVEQIFPNVVKVATHPAKYDSTGAVIFPSFTYKTLDYEKIIPVLIAGHKEQTEKITEKDSIINALVEKTNQQDSINNALYAMITQCCQNNNVNQSTMQNGNGANGNNLNVTNVELSDIQSIILDQNVPNPFAEQTTITFTLTEGVQKAQMLFYNLEGKLIQSTDLSNTAGKGQLNVFSNDLSSGIYSYTLIVDGKIIDTKRMVKQK